MMFTKLLVAYDGSETSKKALDKAISYVKENPAAQMEVVYVLNMQSLVIGEAMINIPVYLENEMYEQAEGIVKEVNERLAGLSDAKAIIKRGSPAPTILQYVEEEGFDVIVIGSRGLGGIREFVLGSVSHNVAQHSKVPVLIVK
ncbi:universal stress protein [Paenibacillus sp. J2TS4]|uniref:universal stress protein n=1 Tax=Paenibacillus sp. J2TS4 TaxID=2807194 RepID=UPI001B19E50E|nr:universal stress protein [Paenibacillus sp. J2TS4]GIP31473.1 universal stress protein UspA [Paenibacillus sp. J2TS4]